MMTLFWVGLSMAAGFLLGFFIGIMLVFGADERPGCNRLKADP
jgi:hypothetical protein